MKAACGQNVLRILQAGIKDWTPSRMISPGTASLASCSTPFRNYLAKYQKADKVIAGI